MTDDLMIAIFNKKYTDPVRPVEKVEDDEGRFKEYYCPICGRNIGLSDLCKCGQEIDWGF